MIKSCGCIVFNNDKVLIIKQINGDYGFPKGHIENGESEIECAIRETLEETNINVTVDSNSRFEISYYVNNIPKKVIYFISYFSNGNILIQEKELLEANWVQINNVRNILTYDNLKSLWDDVMEVYNGKVNF